MRVEHHLGGRAAGLTLPEIYESQDLVGLLSLGDAGVAVAENSRTWSRAGVVEGERRSGAKKLARMVGSWRNWWQRTRKEPGE